MNLFMGEFIVMPNHFHGVLGIGENQYNTKPVSYCRDAMHRVSTTKPANQFGPQSKNLASIIRGFKSAVTINARLINSNFTWQPRFHDHIIRDKNSFQRISKYIKNNPQNWKEDGFFRTD
jgi:REP element-mobilizing transposase RayT